MIYLGLPPVYGPIYRQEEMFTHEIVTTCSLRRRGLLRRRTVEMTIVTEVQADNPQELGRITRAVLAAVDDALPNAYVTSQPRRTLSKDTPHTSREDPPMDEITRRMAEAESVEAEGDYRGAARLYNQLGKDIQARHGRFDPRALDAFEGVARSIGKTTT